MSLFSFYLALVCSDSKNIPALNSSIVAVKSGKATIASSNAIALKSKFLEAEAN